LSDSFQERGLAVDTSIKRFDARRAFPEGPTALIRPLGFIALVAAVVVFVEISPPSAELAVSGLVVYFIGSVAVVLVATRFRADVWIGKVTKRLATMLWALLPPAWIAFCTFRGTRSSLWSLASFVITFLICDSIAYLANRRRDMRHTPGLHTHPVHASHANVRLARPRDALSRRGHVTCRSRRSGGGHFAAMTSLTEWPSWSVMVAGPGGALSGMLTLAANDASAPRGCTVARVAA